MTIDHRLATYGSLAPERENHHQLADLRGEWQAGQTRGFLGPNGWGARLGYRALTLADDGDMVELDPFTSVNLPQHWDQLDAFEGNEYRRVIVKVMTANGIVDGWIYADAVSQQ